MDIPSPVPTDAYNQELIAQVHPADWQNPIPTGTYNLVVIGGGTAGIISALGTAGLGGKVALIERHLLGGDCLNYGCVPSKALIRAARACYDARAAAEFGLVLNGAPSVDFPAIMQRMRRVRAQISHHDSAARFAGLGVDIFFGDAHFTGPRAIEVGSQRLEFRRCILATGGRAATPKIPGLEEVGFHTNESIFSLTELPARLLIIGGGPIGCELAQAFRRFGSEVMIVNRSEQCLAKEETDASLHLEAQLVREGVQIFNRAQVVRCGTVVQRAVPRKLVTLETQTGTQSVECDAILVAAGRAPNLDGLGLDSAGIDYDKQGVTVDDFLRTSNSRVLAAGDIIGKAQFTHAADAMARACIQNAFFFGRQRLSRIVIPRTTYTDPEIASIGLTIAQCADKRIAIDTYRETLGRVDRAVLDGEDQGFAMIHCQQGTGRVVGATIVARHAGEMIGELSLLMTNKLPLGALAKTVHCYPTQVEVLKRCADQYNKSRLTPRLAGWLRWILRHRS